MLHCHSYYAKCMVKDQRETGGRSIKYGGDLVILATDGVQLQKMINRLVDFRSQREEIKNKEDIEVTIDGSKPNGRTIQVFKKLNDI